jgi:CRP-like cAMP-binding protein
MDLIDYFSNARNAQEMAAGTVFFAEGDAVGPMYVLLEGAARILLGHQVIEVASPGSIFGEMALIDDQRRSASVTAITRCRVVAIRKAEFDLLVKEKPEFARHVMKVVADRLRRMSALYTELNEAHYEAAALFRLRPPPRAPQAGDSIPT